MTENNNKDKSTRRDFLTTVTATVGVVGVGAGILPVISHMNPDASVKALASIEVDILIRIMRTSYLIFLN